MKPKLVLGLSGGVDSAVAATRLMAEYEVHCLFLDIGLGGSGEQDARAVAGQLGLPFAVAEIGQALEREVCAPFVQDYLAGRTPIPCARCNPAVKFPALLAQAQRLGADYISTGHYARIRRDATGRALLLRGLPANDQSYMLARLPQSILQSVIFPLGDYEKAQVRALAGREALTVAHKPDSMEICFIPDNDYAAWLERRGTTPPPGDFVDSAGHVLGRHKGIHHYTLGQRRGLGISAAGRLFVSALDPCSNRVVLSDGGDLFTTTAHCTAPNWIAFDAPAGPMALSVRLRHSKAETQALVIPTADGVTLQMKTPARAPTPGQMAVFYDGDVVVGSAWIGAAAPEPPGHGAQWD